MQLLAFPTLIMSYPSALTRQLPLCREQVICTVKVSTVNTASDRPDG